MRCIPFDEALLSSYNRSGIHADIGGKSKRRVRPPTKGRQRSVASDRGVNHMDRVDVKDEPLITGYGESRWL